MRKLLILLSLVLVPCLAAAEEFRVPVEDFSAEASMQSVIRYLPSGDLGATKACWTAEGREGGAMRLDYEFLSAANEHIVYLRTGHWVVPADAKVEFWARGDGQSTAIYLALIDDAGGLVLYGPNSGLADMNTSSREWKRFVVDLSKDGRLGEAALGRITRIGFMCNDNGRKEPYKGSVTFDDIALIVGAPSLQVTPVEISPNGDGIADSAKVQLFGAATGSVVARLSDAQGREVRRLELSPAPGNAAWQVEWDGKLANGRQAPAGAYRCEVSAQWDGKPYSLEARLSIVRVSPLRTAKPVDGFFPIGAWYEGSPSYNGCPSDPKEAAAYYEKSFSDLAAHGVDTLAIPNLPASHRDAVLRTAQRHGLKIVLEVGEVAGLLSDGKEHSEMEFRSAARKVVDQLKDYPALLRYQIRDEPTGSMVETWALAKRALEGLDPEHPAFSCFCTMDSMSAIFDRTKVNEAVFDMYPLGHGAPPGALGPYLPWMDTVVGIAKDRPLWMVLQCHGGDNPATFNLRNPSPAELRLMTYLALTRGSKGIFYFIYQTFPGVWDGMVDRQMNHRPIFDEVAKLSAELHTLAPTMLSLHPIESIVSDSKGLEARTFADKAGVRHIILANQNVLAPRRAVIKLKLPACPKSIIDLRTGAAVSLAEREAGEVAVSLRLGPGDGAVFKIVD